MRKILALLLLVPLCLSVFGCNDTGDGEPVNPDVTATATTEVSALPDRPTKPVSSITYFSNLSKACDGKSCIELVTTVTSKDDLLTAFGESYNLLKLDEYYPIQCLRKDGNGYYAVYHTKDTWIVGYYTLEEAYIYHEELTFAKQASDFERITVGMSIDEVLEFSPETEGVYLFLQTGYNGTPKISYHYTEDGYRISIHYGSDLIVTEITAELL
ncbi:MAG TPA: hypothetical protein P5116_07930 [Eubacteriales bacterium]|nr:hypothetical protein [Eubacteriales bacterium]